MIPPFMMGPDQPNPFSVNGMVFEYKLTHDETGNYREGVISLTVPVNLPELYARKQIMELAWKCGWRVKNLKRLDNMSEIGG